MTKTVKTSTLYHNPRCSKSREALRMLEERGTKLRVVRYLDTPPTAPELKDILKRLGLQPRDLIRQCEPLFASLKLDDPSVTDAALVRAMAENPVLIERPIFDNGTRAIIGRPPERVLELLDV